MKTLVVYYSLSGNNALLAKRIASKFQGDLEEIKTDRKYQGFFGMFRIIGDSRGKKAVALHPLKNNVADYDLVILVAPTWGGLVAAPLYSFMVLNKDKIKKAAYINMSGGALGDNTLNLSQVPETLGKKPVASQNLYTRDILLSRNPNKKPNTMGFKLDEAGLDFYQKEIDAFLSQLGN